MSLFRRAKAEGGGGSTVNIDTIDANPPSYERSNPSTNDDGQSRGVTPFLCCYYCQYCDPGPGSRGRACPGHVGGIMRQGGFGMDGHRCAQGAAMHNDRAVQQTISQYGSQYSPSSQQSSPSAIFPPPQPPNQSQQAYSQGTCQPHQGAQQGYTASSSQQQQVYRGYQDPQRGSWQDSWDYRETPLCSRCRYPLSR